MNRQDIQKALNTLAKLAEDNEKIALPLFAVKLAKASEAYPDDYTIGMMNNIIARMGDTKLFITRSELRDMYHKLYARNTKFPEIFADELRHQDPNQGPRFYDRKGTDLPLSTIAKITDETDHVLLNELQSAFGTKTKVFNAKVAADAKRVCADLLGVDVETIDSDSRHLVCRADFETPKGSVSVFIPIEVVSNSVLPPMSFVGNDGVETLSKADLESYVQKHSGKRLSVQASDVFAMIAGVKYDVDKILLARVKKADVSDSEALSEAFDKDADTLSADHKDQEIETFAHQFGSKSGVASFAFGSQMVHMAKSVVLNKLARSGYSRCQIAVCDSTDNSISYAVSLVDSNLAFKVPVKIAGNRAIEPSIVVANGRVEEFSKDGIKRLVNLGSVDYKAASLASPLHDLNASSLVDIVRSSLSEGNYLKAEDALNVLANGNDERAYQSALSIFTSNVGAKKEVNAHKCNRVVKNANSQHELCGHLNLPLHKVYQDAHGDCHPLYRRGMSETYDGASFMHSKILIGN